ncbi:MAG TPA: carboxypeptidase regulatory-like domain-containing protein, partial [Candidatus Polarisedimenticolaceae bacterium]|nr:carboxypeptidase regulatory-like domain-containing protein [Candidatus Polarisedimenticolaceae bacterium]
MRRSLASFALIAAIAAGTAARAQTSEIAGKVLDTAGNPVAAAKISAANKDFPDRVYKTTSDKKGSYFLPGLLYTAQAPLWNVSIAADGFVPQTVKIVARTGDKTLYLEDTVVLSATTTSFEVKLKAFAEIKADFVMRPGDAQAESSAAAVAAPGAAPSGAGAPGAGATGGAPDTYQQAIEKVRAGDPEGSVDLFKKAIEEKPDDWERRDLLAKVLLKLDRQGEATIQANKAVGLAPDKAAPLLTLTDIYMARGLPDKAAESIAKAGELEPDNLKVLERRASLAATQGKVDEAIALNEKVLA